MPGPIQPTLLEVECQDCGEVIALVHKDEIALRLKTGEYVKGVRLRQGKNWQGDDNLDTYDTKVLGICKACKRLAATAPDKSDGGIAQHNRIMARLALIRERRPDLTLKQATAAAIADEFDPHNEPNMAFRAWLLEHAERDKSRDADIAATYADGPHAGGAA